MFSYRRKHVHNTIKKVSEIHMWTKAEKYIATEKKRCWRVGSGLRECTILEEDLSLFQAPWNIYYFLTDSNSRYRESDALFWFPSTPSRISTTVSDPINTNKMIYI